MYLIYLTFINVLCLTCNSNICNDTVSSEAPVRSASLSWPSADVQDVIIINDTTQSFKCQTLKKVFTVLMWRKWYVCFNTLSLHAFARMIPHIVKKMDTRKKVK